jgi:UDP-4-amino-4,6-dideoxy-N-acetyl-beta-L-altrosamine transaminase
MRHIPYGRQDITEADIDAVVSVLRSDWLTQGPAVTRFETAVSGYCGAREAVAVNSATSALHIACLALGLGPGDLIWTSPITYVASANAARFCGADVDFVDIDERSYNISLEALADKLGRARAAGRLPKIVMPVHFAGQSCDMRGIDALAREYGFAVIEDASHAIGGRYLGKPVGGCEDAAIAVFSFHPVKIVTTGEGGMAVTNDHAVAERMRLLRSHGVTRDPRQMPDAPHGAWYYAQIELGFNYRMTELQAALGSSQMTRIDEYVAARHRIAGRYDRLLADLPLTLPWQDPDCRSALHLYPVHLDAARAGRSREEVFAHMRESGIGVNVHYIPVNTQPYYRSLRTEDCPLPNAERYYAGALSLPLYPGLDESRQDYVISSLRRALG